MAAVPPNGSGYGVSDPDPISSRSLDATFTRLRPKTLRFIVDWDIADDPGEKAQALDRIARARRAGVEEIAITFERPPALLPNGLPDPPSPEAWLAKVSTFIQEFAPYVDWWSPANEPNLGTAPLPKLRPELLARYSSALADWVGVYQPQERLISPEFTDGGELTRYIGEFRSAGGQFGSAIGWHPYNGAQDRSLASTNELLAAVPDVPLWITEVGVHENDPRQPGQTQGEQDVRVRWLTEVLAKHPRVWRISYYHLRDHNSAWDTALVDSQGIPRLAWYTWCAASHGGDRTDPDCFLVDQVDTPPPVPGELPVFSWDPSPACLILCGGR
jgi:hypothetical protein